MAKGSDLSEVLGGEIDAVLAGSSRRSIRSFVQMMRSLEKRWISELRSDPYATLEMKRRVAEAVFYAALERGVSARTMVRYFKKVRSLGFSSSERELTLVVIFSQSCIRMKLYGMALRVLGPVVEALRRNGDAKSVTTDLRLAESLLEELIAMRS